MQKNTVIKLLRRLKKAIVVPELGPCWEWQGAINKGGYGVTGWHGKLVLVHRHLHQTKHGKLATGLLACHRCDNRKCANPAHIFPGTYKTNMEDAAKKGRMGTGPAKKTSCKRGHPFSPENTDYTPTGTQVCLICRRARGLAYYYNKKK